MSVNESVLLYRPVGLEELRLIYETGMRAFPARLPDQPIFYPVTNAPYAKQIARDWNTKSGTRGGFVTRFKVDSVYASKFERRIVGAKEHEELWVPAQELPEFNARVEGSIDVSDAYFGDGYRGDTPTYPVLAGAGARDQFLAFAKTFAGGASTALEELVAHQAFVFLNFFFWQQCDFSGEGYPAVARDAVLARLESAWSHGSPKRIPLGVVRP